MRKYIAITYAATGGYVNFALMALWTTIDEYLKQANDPLASLKSASTGQEWQCANCEEKMTFHSSSVGDVAMRRLSML